MLDDALAFECDALRGVIVVERSPTEPQISIERVDQDLEASLEALPRGAILSLRLPRALFRVQAPAREVGQEKRKGIQDVAIRGDRLPDHDRWVQALYVAFHDRTEYAGLDEFHVSARVGSSRLGMRNTVTRREVAAKHQLIDLPSCASEGGALEGQREHLGLIELVRHDHAGQDIDITDVVQCIVGKLFAVIVACFEHLCDLGAVDEDTVFALQTHLVDDILEAIPGQVALDVEALDLGICVQQMSPMDIRHGLPAVVINDTWR